MLRRKKENQISSFIVIKKFQKKKKVPSSELYYYAQTHRNEFLHPICISLNVDNLLNLFDFRFFRKYHYVQFIIIRNSTTRFLTGNVSSFME